MSFLVPIQGVLAPPLIINYVPTTNLDCYTATDNNDIISAIHVSNQSNVPATVYVAVYDGTEKWFYAKILGVGEQDEIDDFPIRLLTGHRIRAVASVADVVSLGLVRVTIPGRNIAGAG